MSILTHFIAWNETGIRNGVPQGEFGFGKTVLKMLTKSMLYAKVSYVIDPDSVVWTVSI